MTSKVVVDSQEATRGQAVAAPSSQTATAAATVPIQKDKQSANGAGETAQIVVIQDDDDDSNKVAATTRLNNDDGQLPQIGSDVAQAVEEKASDRSPRIHVTFNRSSYAPVGSLSPATLQRLSRATKRNRLSNMALPNYSSNFSIPQQNQQRQITVGSKTIGQVALPLDGGGGSGNVQAATTTQNNNTGDSSNQAGATSNGNNGTTQATAAGVTSPRESKLNLPKFVEEQLIQENRRKSEKKTFDGSIAELLAQQDLSQIFDSFKEHELEFETYLRPIMQEVITEGRGSLPIEKTERSWDQSETWTFLQKSITRDSKLCTDLVNQHQRDRYVAKISRLREQQLQLTKESERQRKLEDDKLERQRRLEEMRSREFQSKLRKTGKISRQGSRVGLSRQGSFQSVASGGQKMPELKSPQTQIFNKVTDDKSSQDNQALVIHKSATETAFGMKEQSQKKKNLPQGFTREGLDSFAQQQDINNEESNMLLIESDEKNMNGLRGMNRKFSDQRFTSAHHHQEAQIFTPKSQVNVNRGQPIEVVTKANMLVRDHVLSPVRESLGNPSPIETCQTKSPWRVQSPRQSMGEVKAFESGKTSLIQPLNTGSNNWEAKSHNTVENQNQVVKATGENKAANHDGKPTRTIIDDDELVNSVIEPKKLSTFGKQEKDSGSPDYDIDRSMHMTTPNLQQQVDQVPIYDGQGYAFDISDEAGSITKYQYHLSQTTGTRPLLPGYSHLMGNGIWNQDIDCESQNVLVPPPNVLLAQKVQNKLGITQALPGKKRIPGLSQEYTVKQTGHPPEVFPFKPQLTATYRQESDRKKRVLTQRILRETQPHDNSKQLGELFRQHHIVKRGGQAALRNYLEVEESFNKLILGGDQPQNNNETPLAQVSTYSTAKLDESTYEVAKISGKFGAYDPISVNKNFAKKQLSSSKQLEDEERANQQKYFEQAKKQDNQDSQYQSTSTQIQMTTKRIVQHGGLAADDSGTIEADVWQNKQEDRRNRLRDGGDDYMADFEVNDEQMVMASDAFLAEDSIFKVNDESTIPINPDDSIMSSQQLRGTYGQKDWNVLQKLKHYATKSGLKKIAQTHQRLRLQQKQKSSITVSKKSQRRNNNKRSFHDRLGQFSTSMNMISDCSQHLLTERDRFRLPAIDLEALQKQAQKRANSKLDVTHLEPKLNQTSKMLKTPIPYEMQKNKLDLSARRRMSSTGMLEGAGRKFLPFAVDRNRDFEASLLNSSQPRLNSNMSVTRPSKQKQNPQLLEESLKRRGISMGDLIGYWPSAGESKTTGKHVGASAAPTNPQVVSAVLPFAFMSNQHSERKSRATKLSAEYLEMVRASTFRQRKTASTAMRLGEQDIAADSRLMKSQKVFLSPMPVNRQTERGQSLNNKLTTTNYNSDITALPPSYSEEQQYTTTTAHPQKQAAWRD